MKEYLYKIAHDHYDEGMRSFFSFSKSDALNFIKNHPYRGDGHYYALVRYKFDGNFYVYDKTLKNIG